VTWSELIDAIPEGNTLEAFARKLSGGRVAGAGDVVHEAYRAGLVGVHIDHPDVPEWSREIARFARDRFRDNSRNGWQAEGLIPLAAQGSGTGQRAVHFQWAMKIMAHIFEGAQRYNNCASWDTRKCASCCVAVDMAERGAAHAFPARYGTAVIYGNRGTGRDTGMSLGDAADAVHNLGGQLEISYLGGKYDLSSQSLDEYAGVRWGSQGPPQDLISQIHGDLIEQVSEVSDEQAVKDLLFGGQFISTGSTHTAGGPGDPVSPLGPVGAHAQPLLGYDDTDEFRSWYRQTTGKQLSDWVGIFSQSWPVGACEPVTNWPTQLWGPMPYGAFVLKGQDVMRIVAGGVGTAIAFNRVAGFAPHVLPDWGSGQYL
jgi:hypothetical protein